MNLHFSIEVENGKPQPKRQSPPLFKMPQCMGLKTSGERCSRQDNGFIHLDANHLHFCGIHWDVYDRRMFIRRRMTVVVAEQHHAPGTCHKWMAGERWCGHVCAEGSLLCPTHRARDNQRRQRAAAERAAELQEAEAVDNAYTWYRDQNMTWRQVIDHLTAPIRAGELTRRVMHRVARRIFNNPAVIEPDFNREWQFGMYWNWAINGHVGPAPNLVVHPAIAAQQVRPAGLAALARDAQNVHTAVVVEQTNKGLEKLLDASKNARAMRTPEWFAAKWLIRGYGQWNVVQRVVNDMLHWHTQAYCKTANDYLYRRTLDGLYLTIQNIKDSETRIELYKRVFEECHESVGMCCEGHISRMCNVLVGFDETFAPPVPFGEILQNKMAAIAALEVETDEKVRQATAFFNEFAVPEPERAAWLEAF